MGTDRRAFDDVVLEGDGFRLRRPALTDVDRIVAACIDEETQRWLPLPRPYGPAEATGFVETFASQALQTGAGLVSALEVGGQLAGMIDLNSADWRNQTVEIGYWISPDARGQGLASRAAALVARWALTEQDMERVEIRTASGNDASEGAARAAGFAREGVLRSAGFTHQGRVDLVVHGLTRADLTGPQASAD